MNKKIFEICEILKDGKFHTALEIAKKVNYSDKTCRTLIIELNQQIKAYNCKVESKRGYGYRLVGNINLINLNKNNKIPKDKFDRYEYILRLLLNEDKYIKLEELSNKLFISTRCLSLDIKKIEKILLENNLSLERKPYYGIRIIGSEKYKRNLLIILYEDEIDTLIDSISVYTNEYFSKNNISISDIYFKNFIISTYISIKRIEKNFNINNIDFNPENYQQQYKFVSKYFQSLIEYLKLNIKYTQKDIEYLSIRFLSNESINYGSLKDKNVNNLENLIKEIFYFVKITFNVDLENDDFLYNSMYSHLFSLIIRLKFGICSKNPLLDEIKKNIVFEYNIALYICNLISLKYSKVVSEDEIGFIALILHTSSKLNTKKLKNVLIICPTGRGVSNFVVHSYKERFSNYCNLISSCSERDILNIDLNLFDHIFTVGDVDIKGYKVHKINHFLNEEDIKRIEKILKSNDIEIQNIFKENLFIYFDETVTKSEVINKMAEKMSLNIKYPKNIKELILLREQRGMTEMGIVAIPHPIKPLQNINEIGVAIFKDKILWSKNKVSIALFICMDNINTKNEKAYRVLNEIIKNKDLVEKIVNKANYIDFINLIEKMR